MIKDLATGGWSGGGDGGGWPGSCLFARDDSTSWPLVFGICHIMVVGSVLIRSVFWLAACLCCSPQPGVACCDYILHVIGSRVCSRLVMSSIFF